MCRPPLPPVACHSPLLLPGASEVVCDSNCIISPCTAQLNPELMMMVEGRDPVPAGTTWREGRGRMGGRRTRDGEAAGNHLTTLYSSSFQKLSLGGGRWQSRTWERWYFKGVSFFLKKLFLLHSATRNPYTQPILHMYTPPCLASTMFSYHIYVRIQMSL